MTNGLLSYQKVLSFKDTYWVTTISFSSYNEMFAMGGHDKKVFLYSLSQNQFGQELCKFEEQTKPVNVIAFSFDSNLLATAGNSNYIYIYGVNPNLSNYLKPICRILIDKAVSALCFSQDNNYMVAGDDRGNVIFYGSNIAKSEKFGKTLKKVQNNGSSIRKLLFTNNYWVFVYGGYDKNIFIYI